MLYRDRRDRGEYLFEMRLREILVQNCFTQIAAVRIVMLMEFPCHIVLSVFVLRSRLREIGDFDKEIRDGFLPVLLHRCLD